ncbi:glyoxalase [Luminiphilus sp.]|nr:glyoxalase [Luminiphilus sp.]
MSLIIPAIKYEDCNAAIDWLCTVFGFETHFCVEGPSDTVAHAQLRLGEYMIMVGSTDRSDFGVLNVTPGQVGGKVTTSLYVCDEDVDTRFAHAVSVGAEIAIALRDEDHGGQELFLSRFRRPSLDVWELQPMALMNTQLPGVTRHFE